jgi:LPS-assembly protein
MSRVTLAALCLAVLALEPAAARAQQPAGLPPGPPQTPAPPPSPAPTSSPAVPDTTISDWREATNEQKDWHFVGHVEMERPAQKTTIYAEDVKYRQDGDLAIAVGNVLIAQGNNRLAAERAEFNTETGLGTFYHAWGIASVQPPKQQSGPGPALPPSTQETTVYFFGDKIEKIGAKKYRITNGGFSTCVQPTPRWDLHADTVILNVDHYTVLKQAVLTVKGVPMLYLPILYYPTKREDRATGFLIPTYGVSTIRGQSISNAFFWAINRSQDATVMHDWFSKAGQGVGSEYRYNFGSGSDGNIRTYFLNQTATVNPADTSTSSSTAGLPAAKTYELRGGANQMLPGRLRARANVNYFSSVETMQAFNTNIYDSSRNQRSFGGNVVGAWRTYSLNATLDHNEYFYNTTTSNLTGSWPRVSLTRNERPLLGTPFYFSVGSEIVHMLATTKFPGENNTIVETDKSLTRLDVNPQIRFPFKKWQWFTVNTTAGWRDTYYSRSYLPTGDPALQPTVLLDQGLNRRFYTLQAQMVGPVFNRIWDTPENGYAEKFKHTIEPFLTIMRTSTIDHVERIVILDGTDAFFGGTTYTYGVNNRFFAKRTLAPGAPAQAREFISVELSQSYYTNQLQSLYDTRYSSSQIGVVGTTGEKPSNFSSVGLSVRFVPSNDVNTTVRAEFDPRYKQLRTISATATYSRGSRLQTTAWWSKKAFIEKLPGFDNPALLDHAINSSTTLRTSDNRFGGIFSFNYDVLRTTMVNRRMSAFYNAQCCGIAFEQQVTNYPPGYFIPSDRRFFLSFTLAGLGNFSPFNGALSGVPR